MNDAGDAAAAALKPARSWITDAGGLDHGLSRAEVGLFLDDDEERQWDESVMGFESPEATKSPRDRTRASGRRGRAACGRPRRRRGAAELEQPFDAAAAERRQPGPCATRHTPVASLSSPLRRRS